VKHYPILPLLLTLLLIATPCPAGSISNWWNKNVSKSNSRPSGGQITKASWYGGKFHGGPTASGETYDQNSLTAAHKTFPFGTKVRVTNLSNNKSVVVRINNRGPFIAGRGIDLSYAAAKKIGMLQQGVARVKIQKL
jgi:rare lipoprotein A